SAEMLIFRVTFPLPRTFSIPMSAILITTASPSCLAIPCARSEGTIWSSAPTSMAVTSVPVGLQNPSLPNTGPPISLYHLTKWWALIPARPLPPRLPAPRRFLWVPPPHVRDPRYFERLLVGISSPHLIEESIDLRTIIAKRSALYERALRGLVSFARRVEPENRLEARDVAQPGLALCQSLCKFDDAAVRRVGLDVLVRQGIITDHTATGRKQSFEGRCVHFTIRNVIFYLADHPEVLGSVCHKHAVVDVVQTEHLQGVFDVPAGIDHAADLHDCVHLLRPPGTDHVGLI